MAQEVMKCVNWAIVSDLPSSCLLQCGMDPVKVSIFTSNGVARLVLVCKEVLMPLLLSEVPFLQPSPSWTSECRTFTEYVIHPYKRLISGTIPALAVLVDTNSPPKTPPSMNADRGTSQPVTAKGIDFVSAVPESAARVWVHLSLKPERLLLVLSIMNGEPLSVLLPNVLLFPIRGWFPCRVRLNQSWLPLGVPLLLCLFRLWQRVTSLNGAAHLGVLLVRPRRLSCQQSLLGLIKYSKSPSQPSSNRAGASIALRNSSPRLPHHLPMAALTGGPFLLFLAYRRLLHLSLQEVSRPEPLSRFQTGASCCIFVIVLLIAIPRLPSSKIHL